MQLDIAWQDMKQIAKGEHKAVQSNGGLRDREIAEFIRDYQLLSNGPARVMFADRWVRLMAWKMEETWPMLYGALNIIKEDKIYEHPEWMKSGLDRKGPQDDPETFSSFEEYFESRMGKPFTIWAELENTYQFAQKYAPELLGGSYEQARERVVELANTTNRQPTKSEVKKGNDYARKDKDIDDGDKNTNDNIRCVSSYGTSQSYLTARIARDHPEILERMKNGEYPSVRAAAKDAGIVKDLTPLQRAQRLWLKLSEEDRQAFLDFIHEKKE